MKLAHVCMPALLLLGGIAFGGTARDEKIAELMRITGLTEMLEESRVAGRAQAKSVSDQVFDEMLKEVKTLSGEQREKISEATQRFIESCVSSMDVAKAVTLYGQLYSEQLTDQELDQILKYYRSPIGQKDVAATKKAMPQWQARLAEGQTAATQSAIARFTQDLRQIVGERPAQASGGQ